MEGAETYLMSLFKDVEYVSWIAVWKAWGVTGLLLMFAVTVLFWWSLNKILAITEWVSSPQCAPEAGVKNSPERKNVHRNRLNLLLPVIVPLPSRTLTPFQTIGGAATTIQWWVCDVETSQSWRWRHKKKKKKEKTGAVVPFPGWNGTA